MASFPGFLASFPVFLASFPVFLALFQCTSSFDADSKVIKNWKGRRKARVDSGLKLLVVRYVPYGKRLGKRRISEAVFTVLLPLLSSPGDC